MQNLEGEAGEDWEKEFDEIEIETTGFFEGQGYRMKHIWPSALIAIKVFIRRLLTQNRKRQAERLREKINGMFKNETAEKPEGKDLVYDYALCQRVGYNQAANDILKIIEG